MNRRNAVREGFLEERMLRWTESMNRPSSGWEQQEQVDRMEGLGAWGIQEVARELVLGRA